ncbi:MAG: PIN domain-containing protein [Acidiferrobacterales bacterium]
MGNRLQKAKQRLSLPMTVEVWIERALERPGIRLIGLDRRLTVIDSCRLPGDFRSDLTDRLLVAAAHGENAVFAPHDKKILDYGAAGHV